MSVSIQYKLNTKKIYNPLPKYNHTAFSVISLAAQEYRWPNTLQQMQQKCGENHLKRDFFSKFLQASAIWIRIQKQV